MGSLSAQEKKSTYTLNGYIDVDTGKIRLSLQLGDGFYPFDTAKEAVIDHGKFTFTGITSYPFAYFLQAGTYYLSGDFFIGSGIQTITCYKDSLRVVPRISNKTMGEYRGSYRSAFLGYRDKYDKFQAQYDSLKNAYSGHLPDSLLIKRARQSAQLNQLFYRTLITYIKKHPDSYVALSKFGHSLEFGYSPIFDSVYAQFSSTLKHTYTGKAIKKKLDAAKTTDIGKVFPRLALLDTGLSSQTLSLKDGAHKYTLIDFWYSHCGPCLGQFPKYKKIYDKYNESGLEIVGISVDKSKDINDWKKVMHEKELPWPQYLDENGKLADGLVIYSFPRNFLLDGHNTIIKKDITPEQLEQIMTQTLPSNLK